MKSEKIINDRLNSLEVQVEQLKDMCKIQNQMLDIINVNVESHFKLQCLTSENFIKHVGGGTQ